MDKEEKELLTNALGGLSVLVHIFMQLHKQSDVTEAIKKAKQEMLHGTSAEEFEQHLADAFETLEAANWTTTRLK
jgi:hypothetical protein